MTEEEQAVHDDTRRRAVRGARDPNTRRLLILAAVGVVVGVGAILAGVWLGWEAKQRQVDAGASVIASVRAECARGEIKDRICEQAKDAERTVDEGPQGPPGAPGAKGDKGDPGTDGKDGRNGKDGKPGRKGDKGDPGTDGGDGADSTVEGPEGQPGADSTVPGPKGDTGEPGKPGTDGKDGQSAFPFSFSFTIPPSNPSEPERTFLVQCSTTGAGCTVTSSSSDPEPPVN